MYLDQAIINNLEFKNKILAWWKKKTEIVRQISKDLYSKIVGNIWEEESGKFIWRGKNDIIIIKSKKFKEKVDLLAKLSNVSVDTDVSWLDKVKKHKEKDLSSSDNYEKDFVKNLYKILDIVEKNKWNGKEVEVLLKKCLMDVKNLRKHHFVSVTKDEYKSRISAFLLLKDYYRNDEKIIKKIEAIFDVLSVYPCRDLID